MLINLHAKPVKSETVYWCNSLMEDDARGHCIRNIRHNWRIQTQLFLTEPVSLDCETQI